MSDPPAEQDESSTPLGIRTRLSAMMFLHYSSLGVWGVTVGTYIAANTESEGSGIFAPGFVGYSTAAGAIGSLLAPFIVGYLSDRFFPAQYLLAAMHVGCAMAAVGMYLSTSQTAFFVWLLVYFHCFLPGCTLTNTICLRHLRTPEAEYPLIRIFSTIGWISAGLVVGLFWPNVTGASIENTAVPLLLGAAANCAMFLYAFALPATPPRRPPVLEMDNSIRSQSALFSNKPLVAFLLVSALAAALSMAYTNYGNLFLNRSGFPRPAALMTIGQLTDMMCLWATPWLIARVGLRRLFALGVLAWAIRYFCLAAGANFGFTWAVYLAIAIHGPCFVFVYVVGLMFVDRLADPVFRGGAQGLHSVATSGVGHLLGGGIVGYSQVAFLTPPGVSPAPYHWAAFWIVPAILSSLTLCMYVGLSKTKRFSSDHIASEG